MCGESFRISETNIYNKESIICQNCEQEMPQDILELIKQYIDYTTKAKDCLRQISDKTIVDKNNLINAKFTWSVFAYSGVSGRLNRNYPDTKPDVSGHLIDRFDFNLICHSFQHS
jgi:hypothetical protein